MTFPSEAARGAARTAAGVLALAFLAAAGSPLAAQEEVAADQERPARHEVDRGDTLWDLAARYLADPFSWPRIFEVNRDVVEDPHWIYPGEVLRLPGAEAAADVTGVEVAEREPTPADTAGREPRPAGEDPFAGPSVFDRDPGQSVTTGDFSVEDVAEPSLVSASTFYSSGFLADYPVLQPRGTLVRVMEENPLGLEIPPSARIGQEVMVSLGGMSAAPGDTLQAIREDRGVGGGLSVVNSQGLLEVGKVAGDSARATVIRVFDNLSAGDHVIPMESYTAGELRGLRSVDDGLRARVRALAVEQPLVSTGDIVFLDVGSGSDVSLGDEFAVFPADVGDPAAAEPRDRLAVLRVVRVRDRTSTARVTGLRDLGIRVGAPALRVRRPVQSGR